jgi:hypothetical protein
MKITRHDMEQAGYWTAHFRAVRVVNEALGIKQRPHNEKLAKAAADAAETLAKAMLVANAIMEA